MARFTSYAAKTPPKKTVKISLARDVYLDAKKFGINISQLCEQRLRQEVQKREGLQWSEQHANFLAVYNKEIKAEGGALQDWRAF